MAPKRISVYFDIAIGTKPGGRIVFELFTDVTPKAAENFRGLCTGEYGLSGRTGKPLHYLGTCFFRSMPGLLIQGGDIHNNDGTGGECVWGGTFRDENFIRRHSQAGCLAMANNGRNTNGSQFYITLKKAASLDNRHVVIGQLIEGMEVLRAMELVPTDGKTSKPKVPIVVAACGELGAGPRRLDGLNAVRMQLDEIMDKYVREETKKQEEAHKLVDSDGDDSNKSGSSSSENETAAHRRLRRRMKRKKQRYLKSALFKGQGLFKQIQQEAAHELKDKYAGIKGAQGLDGSDEEEEDGEEEASSSSDSEENTDKEGEGEETAKMHKKERRKVGEEEEVEKEDEEGEKKKKKESIDTGDRSKGKEAKGVEEIDVLLSDLEEEEDESEGDGSEEEGASGEDVKKREEERKKRLLQLRLKINQGRKLTNKEVIEEKRKWNDPLYEKKKAEGCVRLLMRELHGGGPADDEEGGEKKKNKRKMKDKKGRGGEAGSRKDEDESSDEGDSRSQGSSRRGYLNEAAAMTLDRKAKEERRSETKSFGWNVFNQDALYRAHKKRLAEVSFREDEYNKQKAALGGEAFYDPSTAALSLGDFKPSETAKERLVESIENVQKRRKNFSRRRTFYEDDNVTYINERNRIYNEKIERAFGATSLEYRQNLERGTAL